MKQLPKTIPIAIPEGLAAFPKLQQPDFHPQYHPEGEYSCDVALDPESEEYGDLHSKLTKFGEAWMAQMKADGDNITEETRFKLPFSPQKDKEKQPTGMMLVKAKLKAKVKLSPDEPAISQRPMVLGPDAKPYEEIPRIGGGSTVRVGADAYCTLFGATDTFYVSLRLRGVQIVNLIEFGELSEANYGTYGFEAASAELATPEGEPKF